MLLSCFFGCCFLKTWLKYNLWYVGSLPIVSKGTHVIIPLVDHLEDERWEAKIVEQNGKKIKLSVNSPPNAVIGLYGLTVTTGLLASETTSSYTSNKNIFILFNPWCEGKLAVGVNWIEVLPRLWDVEERADRRQVIGGEKWGKTDSVT